MQVLALWAVCTATSLLILRLGAADTGATPWAGPSPSWGEHLRFWDAGWYERIARQGYPAVLPVDGAGVVQQNAWAFMPLLPLLTGLLTWSGAGFYPLAAVVCLAASAGAAVVLDRWLAPRAGGSASLWAVALVWSSPCAAVLQVPYGESLGLLLVCAGLWLAGRRRFIAALPLAALAALARPVGVPLTGTLGLWWLMEEAQARGVVSRATLARLLPGHEVLETRQRRGLLVLVLGAAAATAAWPVAAWLVTGRVDAYTATETAWRQGAAPDVLPWLARSATWVGPHLGWLLVLGVLTAGALVLSAPGVRSLGAVPWCWCVSYCLYLLVFFDPTSSVFRLLLPLAPAAWAVGRASTRVRALLLVAGVVGQLFWVSWVWDRTVQMTWIP